MFLKESLYGWGVCDIPMPRSAHDIFSDRRKKNIKIFARDQRRHDEVQGTLACISGILSHDIPWLQTSLTIIFSFLLLIFIFFLSTRIPEFTEKDIPEPVDIMINVIEEFDKIPPVLRTPSQMEKAITEEKSTPVVKPKPEVRQEPVPILREESTFEEVLPEVRISSGVERKPLMSNVTPVPEITSFEKPTRPEEIKISIPTDQTLRYNDENIARTERDTIPQQSTLVLEKSEDKPEVVAQRLEQKRYDLKATTQVKAVPSVNADSFMDRSDNQAETVFTAKLPKKDYKITAADQAVAIPSEETDALFSKQRDSVADITRKTSSNKNYDIPATHHVEAIPTGRTDSFLTQQDSPASVITPAGRTQKIYKSNLDPGNRVSAAPSIKSDPFLKKPDTSAAAVSPVSSPIRSYQLNAADKDRISAPKNMSDSNSFASDLPSQSDDVSLSQPDELARAYALDTDGSTHQSSVLPGSEDQSEFLVPQQDTMIQEEDLEINISTRPASNPAQGNATAVGVPGGSPDFLNINSIDEIDPSQIINLKQLAVCADPEEEFLLKTKLATLLTGPAKCGSDGILFFFKYTESGYTIQVNIYNPKGELLKDRCSVLHLAIDCVENLRAKGDRP